MDTISKKINSRVDVIDILTSLGYCLFGIFVLVLKVSNDLVVLSILTLFLVNIGLASQILWFAKLHDFQEKNKTRKKLWWKLGYNIVMVMLTLAYLVF